MKIWEFEQAVWSLEGVRVVIRDSANADVGDYNYKKQAPGKWRITEFIEKKIDTHLNGQEVVIVSGDGEQPNGNSLVKTIRNGYC